MAQKLYKTAVQATKITAEFNDNDYIQLLTRYNQLAACEKVVIITNEDAITLFIFVMILELEFISDDDVGYAITKFINLDNKRLENSAFIKLIKEEVSEVKLPRFLKALGFVDEFTVSNGYALLALTGYLRSSINFVMETDKKSILRLSEPLPDYMKYFIRALYITNSYTIGTQSGLHDFLTELWEDTLSDERLLDRPFAYVVEPVDASADGEDTYDSSFDVDKEQLAATAALDRASPLDENSIDPLKTEENEKENK